MTFSKMDPNRKRRAIMIDQQLSQAGDGDNPGKKKSIIDILKMINPGMRKGEHNQDAAPTANITREESKADIKPLSDRKG